jgi:DNA repair protein SbcC/Rad50
MPSQKTSIDDIDDEIIALTKVRDDLAQDAPSKKVAEFNRLNDEIVATDRAISDINEETSRLKLAKKDLTHKLRAANKKLEKFRCDVVDTVDERVAELKRQIVELETEIDDLDDERIAAAKELGHAKSELKRMLAEFRNWQTLRAELRKFELFMKAVNKRGIPTLILRKLAPVINQEIAAILQGVVDFTINIEAPEQGNAMNIFLDYGDSKRILEAGSGMEKMISSLAIRVALTNVSSLPKTDMLILDEGFGALDETNIEACNRLLISLKRWFKNILVITHVDGIKDIADNLLEITRDEKDSKVVYI